MTSLVHKDQVGFMHKCSSGDNIRWFFNIIWAVSNSNSPIASVSLDAEKVFKGGRGDFCLGLEKCLVWEELLLSRYIYYIIAQKQQYKLIDTLIHILNWGEVDVKDHYLALCSSVCCLNPWQLKLAIMMGVTYNGSIHKLLIFANDILLLVSDPAVSIPSLLYTINTNTQTHILIDIDIKVI